MTEAKEIQVQEAPPFLELVTSKDQADAFKQWMGRYFEVSDPFRLDVDGNFDLRALADRKSIDGASKIVDIRIALWDALDALDLRIQLAADGQTAQVRVDKSIGAVVGTHSFLAKSESDLINAIVGACHLAGCKLPTFKKAKKAE